MLKLVKKIFIPRRTKGKVLLFPKYKSQINPHDETSSSRRYIAELLKMQGYHTEINLYFSEQFFDILIPNHHYLVYCSLEDRENVIAKVYQKRLKNIAKSHGLRLFIVYKTNFYKDLNLLLAKLKVNLH